MKSEIFFEKFEQLADAPNAIAKMRELVLQLAVQGKLVPQDPNDEPALCLLERISAHKAALSKSGKLRGSNSVTPMAPQDSDFGLPSSWTWVRFGEIMVNRDGERIPVSKEERATKVKTYDYYGASGVIDKIDGYLFDKPLLLIGEDGANLINRSTPIAFIARGKYWVNNHAHVLDGISEDFLRYIELHINAINLEPYVTGTAQPKMNQAKMNNIPIALPPLAEQRRIVAKVDELIAFCDRLEAQLQERDTRQAALARASIARFAEAPTPANLNFLFHDSYTIEPAELRKTILTLAIQGKLLPQVPNDEPAEDLFRRVDSEREHLVKAKKIRRQEPLGPIADQDFPYSIPDSWQWRRLADVCFLITDGAHHTPKYEEGGVPFLSVKDVSGGEMDFANTRFISQEAHRELCKRCRPEFGDILLTKVGTTGIAVTVEDTREFSIFVSLALLKFSQANLDRHYLKHLINSPFVRQQSAENTQGIGNKNLVLRLINQFSVPIPPLAEQRRIVAKVDQLMVLVDQLEAQLAASRATAMNLMNAAVAELTTEA
jgi:type I restriction enzyme, S subunit